MGLTQEEAAAKLGCSRWSFVYWENGDRIPNPLNLRKYHSLLFSWQRQIDDVG